MVWVILAKPFKILKNIFVKMTFLKWFTEFWLNHLKKMTKIILSIFGKTRQNCLREPRLPAKYMIWHEDHLGSDYIGF